MPTVIYHRKHGIHIVSHVVYENMSKVIDNIKFTFLYCDRYTFGRSWKFYEEYVPYSMLRCIDAGEGKFKINRHEIQAQKGLIIYIPKGSTLECSTESETITFTSIRFNMPFNYAGEDLLTDYYHIPLMMESEGEDEYFDLILRWVKSSSDSKMFFVRGYLEILIGSLIERATHGKIESPEKVKDIALYDLSRIRNRLEKSRETLDPRIQIVVDYILLHPKERYTPESLGRMAQMSKQHFSRLFKRQTGKPPMGYIREYRLSIAARELLVSSENIGEVAYSVGYQDTNYFIREFKKAFGCTPVQYRKVSYQ
jgi:AraC-like DNA-binding protein